MPVCRSAPRSSDGRTPVPDDIPEPKTDFRADGFAGLDVKLLTARFSVRTLKPIDVGTAYAAWFEDPIVRQFIAWRPVGDPVQELRDFVAGHDARDDSLLLGIFTVAGRHVANLKYEPIDLEQRTAVLGVLVGDAVWRGRGLFGEVFSATVDLLNHGFGIQKVLLGVDGENAAALVAYERAGFAYVPQLVVGPVWMEYRLE